MAWPGLPWPGPASHIVSDFLLYVRHVKEGLPTQRLLGDILNKAPQHGRVLGVFFLWIVNDLL